MTELEQIKEQINRKGEYVKRVEKRMESLDPNGAAYAALDHSLQSVLAEMAHLIQFTFAKDAGDPRTFRAWGFAQWYADFRREVLKEWVSARRMDAIEKRILEIERIGRD